MPESRKAKVVVETSDSLKADQADILALEIPEELDAKIKSAARNSGCCTEELVHRAILQGFNVMETTDTSEQA